MTPDAYCREIEALPDPQERWTHDPDRRPRLSSVRLGGAGRAAEGGIAGIDRYFERYYAKGPRRRPVHVDHCEHDVLEMFDAWRRAVGVRPARSDEPRRSHGRGKAWRPASNAPWRS